ncbi:uncharacterized protein LOC130625276 isoform X1 [Hydractinia symbiolongicarpus]|uniref:uncharacterized protein LOC130625276 isoform X1 n=2 Tax=Hydractinia symbiolongicarpus TaxID=13093 RepID=UPI002549D5FD|nr:uncharacterized protein LOC130625276 isoform X1 [Hydractinia symbiolongicarpus]
MFENNKTDSAFEPKVEKLMGNQSSNFITCPNCNVASFDIKRLPTETIVNHINQCYRVKCPYCPVHNSEGFSSGLDLVNHVKYYHNGEYEQHQAMLGCPKCFQGLSNETDLINHHIQYHLQREDESFAPSVTLLDSRMVFLF